MQVVIGHAQALTNTDGAMLELLEGEELVCHAASGGAARYVGLRLAVQGTLCGYAVSTCPALCGRHREGVCQGDRGVVQDVRRQEARATAARLKVLSR